MADYLPLLTTIVSFAFFVLLVRQYLQRHKIHQLLWTVAMLFYSASALMEFLMNSDVMGANIPSVQNLLRPSSPARWPSGGRSDVIFLQGR